MAKIKLIECFKKIDWKCSEVTRRGSTWLIAFYFTSILGAHQAAAEGRAPERAPSDLHHQQWSDWTPQAGNHGQLAGISCSSCGTPVPPDQTEAVCLQDRRVSETGGTALRFKRIKGVYQEKNKQYRYWIPKCPFVPISKNLHSHHGLQQPRGHCFRFMKIERSACKARHLHPVICKYTWLFPNQTTEHSPWCWKFSRVDTSLDGRPSHVVHCRRVWIWFSW